MYFIHPFGFIRYDTLPPILFFTAVFIIFISYGKEERCGVQFNSSRHGNLYEDKAIDKNPVPTWESTSFLRCAFNAIYIHVLVGLPPQPALLCTHSWFDQRPKPFCCRWYILASEAEFENVAFLLCFNMNAWHHELFHFISFRFLFYFGSGFFSK